MATAESVTYGALQALAGARVYPDAAPAGAARPYVVYQAAGGLDATTFDGPNRLRNCRMQVAVWSDMRGEASEVMEQVIQALTTAPVKATPIGAPVSDYDEETKLRGSRLDFSIWYNV